MEPGLPWCDDAIIWSSNQHKLLDAQEVFPPCLGGEVEKWITFFSYNAHFSCTSTNIQHTMATTVTHSITFHVVVRSVSVKQWQKAVALHVAGPVVRVCGEKINVYLGKCNAMCRFSSLIGKYVLLFKWMKTPSLFLTVPVVANRNFLSHSVVANTKHCTFHVVRKYPLQVICVCGQWDIPFFFSDIDLLKINTVCWYRVLKRRQF